jgi:hypothetical protein
MERSTVAVERVKHLPANGECRLGEVLGQKHSK